MSESCPSSIDQTQSASDRIGDLFLRHSSLFVAVFIGPEQDVETASEEFLRHIQPEQRRLGRPAKEVMAGMPRRFFKALTDTYDSGLRAELRETKLKSIQRDGRRQTRYVNFVIEPCPGEDRVLCYGWDVTEHVLNAKRERLAEEVAQQKRLIERQTADIITMSRQVMAAEYEERQRLGRLLHDELQPLLVTLKHQLSMPRSHALPETAPHGSPSPLSILDEAITCSRSLSHRISPLPPKTELPTALSALAALYAQRTRLNVHFEVSLNRPLRLPQETTDFVYRAVRELLLNTLKHAEAENAWIELTVGNDDILIVQFSDDGKGCDPDNIQFDSKKGVGLPEIKDRTELLGGRFSVSNGPHGGVVFKLMLPLEG